MGKILGANLGVILQSHFSSRQNAPSKKRGFFDNKNTSFLISFLVNIFDLYFALKSKSYTYILAYILPVYRRKSMVIHNF